MELKTLQYAFAPPLSLLGQGNPPTPPQSWELDFLEWCQQLMCFLIYLFICVYNYLLFYETGFYSIALADLELCRPG